MKISSFNMVAITDILLYGFTLSLIVAFLVSFVYGSRKSKRRVKELEDIIRSSMKEYSNVIEGPTKVRADTYEFRCKPANKDIGVLTINHKALSEIFPNNVVNKLLKAREEFFIGIKFRTNGRDFNPSYRFELVPYREKGLIRQNFDDFITLDDIKVSNSSIEKQFMIKSGSEIEISHYTTNEKFQEFTENLESNIKYLSLRTAKEDQDAHLQLTILLKQNELGKISNVINYFFLTATLHIENRARVEKLTLTRKVKTISKRTKSARIRKKKGNSGKKQLTK